MESLDKHLRDPEYANWVKTGLALIITNNTIKPYIISESEKFKTSIESKYLSGPTRCTFEAEIKNSHRFTNPSYSICNRDAWTTDSWEVAKCFMPSLKRYELCTSAEADFSAIVNIIINNRHFETLVNSDLSTNGNIFCQAREMRNKVMHSNDQKVTESDFQNNADLLKQIIGSFKSVLPNYAEAVDKINKLKSGQMIITIDDVSDARREGLVAMMEEVEMLVMKAGQVAEAGQVILKEMVEVSKEEIRGLIDVEIERLRQQILSNTSISKEHRIRANFKDGCHHSLLALFPSHIQRHRPKTKGLDEWTLLDFLGKIDYAPEMGIFSERHRDMLYPIDGEPVTPDKWDLFLLCQFLLVETKIELPNGIALYLKGLKTIRNKLLENPESVDFDDLVSLCDFLDEPIRESTKQIFCRDIVDVDIVLVDSVLDSWRTNENNFSQSKVNDRFLNGLKEQSRKLEELQKQMEEFKTVMAMINPDKSAEAGNLGTRPKIKPCIGLHPRNCEKADAKRVEKNITSKEGNLAKENGSIDTFTKKMNLEGTEPKQGSIILEVTLSSIKDLIDFWDKCVDGRAVDALRDVRNTYRKFVGCQDLEFEVILTKQEVDRCLNQMVDDLVEGMNARGILRELGPKNLVGSRPIEAVEMVKSHGVEKFVDASFKTPADIVPGGTTKREEFVDPERDEEAKRLVKFLRQIAENLEGGQISTVRGYLDTIVESAVEGAKKAFDKATEDFINAVTFKSGISVNLIKQSVRGLLIIQEQPSFGKLVSSKLRSIEAEQKEQRTQFAEISTKPFAGASSVKSSVLIEEDIEVKDVEEEEATTRIRRIQEMEREKTAMEPLLKHADDPLEKDILFNTHPPRKSSATDKASEISELEEMNVWSTSPSTSEEKLKYAFERGVLEAKSSKITKDSSEKRPSYSTHEKGSVDKPTKLEPMEETDETFMTAAHKSPKEIDS